MKTMSLTAVGLLVTAPAWAGGWFPKPPGLAQAEPATTMPAAFGDLPMSGSRRRGRRTRDSKPPAPPEARKDVQGETEEQHKAYLKRYGF